MAAAVGLRGKNILAMRVAGCLVRVRIVSLCRVFERGLRACRWQIGCDGRRRWCCQLGITPIEQQQHTGLRISLLASGRPRYCPPRSARLAPRTCLSDRAMLADLQA